MTTLATIDQFQQPELQFVGRQPVGTIRNWLSHLPVVGHIAEGRRLYRLCEDYCFTFDARCAVKPLQGTEARIWVYATNPDGSPHIYDKASTPVIAEILGYVPDGEHEGGALVHDKLYEDFFQLAFGCYQENIPGQGWVPVDRLFTRDEADAILAYMAQLGGMSATKAYVEEMAVKAYPPNWGKEAEGKRRREHAAHVAG
jgi:hypothetical protein